jgi:hypothetical protein
MRYNRVWYLAIGIPVLLFALVVIGLRPETGTLPTESMNFLSRFTDTLQEVKGKWFSLNYFVGAVMVPFLLSVIGWKALDERGHGYHLFSLAWMFLAAGSVFIAVDTVRMIAFAIPAIGVLAGFGIQQVVGSHKLSTAFAVLLCCILLYDKDGIAGTILLVAIMIYTASIRQHMQRES